MKRWLFNPFVYVAGSRALMTGLGIMALTTVTAYFSHTHFDGVLDLHYGAVSPISGYVREQVVLLVSLVASFYAAGLIFSRSSIRLVDVAGTMALARWVMIFAAIIGFGIDMPAEMPKNTEELMSLVTPSAILLSLLSIAFMIWMVALVYNAFSVSCNMKGGKATGVFIAALLVAEIISKALLYLLYK